MSDSDDDVPVIPKKTIKTEDHPTPKRTKITTIGFGSPISRDGGTKYLDKPQVQLASNYYGSGGTYFHILLCSFGWDLRTQLPKSNFKSYLIEFYLKNSPTPFMEANNLSDKNLYYYAKKNNEPLEYAFVSKQGKNLTRQVPLIFLASETQWTDKQGIRFLQDFCDDINQLQWQFKPIQGPKMMSVVCSTPFFGKGVKLGEFLHINDLLRITQELYPDFKPKTGWATNNGEHLRFAGQFYGQEQWTLYASGLFGTPADWLNKKDRELYEKKKNRSCKKDSN